MLEELINNKEMIFLKDKIVLIKMNNEIYLFKSEHITREQRIVIESIIEGMWNDYEEEIAELNQYELLDWVLGKIKTETGIVLESLGIDCEFAIKQE